jgi:probable rRNA maturation factor
VSEGRIRALNRQYRGIDRVTDVLSFAAGRLRARLPPGDHLLFLGDVVIATGVAARQARLAGHSVATEYRILALHGLLHLLGYDHEHDGGRMARLERKLRRRGGLERGLIERTVTRRPALGAGAAT